MLFFAGSGQKFQVTTYRTRLVEAKPDLKWKRNRSGNGRCTSISLKLILDKRNRSFSQASILGKIIELVCEAIVFEIRFSFQRKVEKVTHTRDTRDKVARLTRENPPSIELFALCKQRSK